jgi:hypothetical protein
MSMSPNISSREYEKFFETSDGSTGIRVGAFGGFSAPTGTDTITATYPSSVVEVYQYRSGGVSGTILMTLTVTYTNTTKEFISSVVKT